MDKIPENLKVPVKFLDASLGLILFVQLLILIAVIAPIYIYSVSDEFKDDAAAEKDFYLAITVLLFIGLSIIALLVVTGYFFGEKDLAGGRLEYETHFNKRQTDITTINFAVYAIDVFFILLILSATVDMYYTQEANIDSTSTVSQQEAESFVEASVVLSVIVFISCVAFLIAAGLEFKKLQPQVQPQGSMSIAL